MKRSEIRENVFRLVFCGDFHSQEDLPLQVERYFEEAALPDEDIWLPEISEEEQILITERFEQIKERISELDARINEVAKGWKTDRMGKAELAILRLAVYEMLYDEDVPVKVAINEAVELAKKYGGDDASAFVNGILAKLA
ncbi:MAG: transcription antitermination factor NusB [Lachnospiraceae bacterium]|nr:transcription antitermination factor NusB [Lachnospiraceae bacterium]